MKVQIIHWLVYIVNYSTPFSYHQFRSVVKSEFLSDPKTEDLKVDTRTRASTTDVVKGSDTTEYDNVTVILFIYGGSY